MLSVNKNEKNLHNTESDKMSVLVIMRIIKNTDNYSGSLTTFLRYNLHAINCTCLKCTTSCILTHVCAYDIVTIKLWSFLSPLSGLLALLPAFITQVMGHFYLPSSGFPACSQPPSPSSCGTFLSPLCRPLCHRCPTSLEFLMQPHPTCFYLLGLCLAFFQIIFFSNTVF